MDLRDTYNKIAEDWHKDHTEHLKDKWWVEAIEIFNSLNKPGDKVLDIGCGPGHKSKYFVEKGFKVTGIDFSEKMIEIAKKEIPEGNFLVMDAKDISALNDEFDAICAFAILLHIRKDEAQKVIQGWTSKIKQGGYLYISTKEKTTDEPDEALVKENDYGYSYERFFSFFTRPELRDYFKNAGLKIVWENQSSGERPWIVIVGQKQ